MGVECPRAGGDRSTPQDIPAQTLPLERKRDDISSANDRSLALQILRERLTWGPSVAKLCSRSSRGCGCGDIGKGQRSKKRPAGLLSCSADVCRAGNSDDEKNADLGVPLLPSNEDKFRSVSQSLALLDVHHCAQWWTLVFTATPPQHRSFRCMTFVEWTPLSESLCSPASRPSVVVFAGGRELMNMMTSALETRMNSSVFLIGPHGSGKSLVSGMSSRQRAVHRRCTCRSGAELPLNVRGLRHELPETDLSWAAAEVVSPGPCPLVQPFNWVGNCCLFFFSRTLIGCFR